MTQQTILLIGGPTASGKSALAMTLARRLQGTIINADALQVYSGLPILTAQPDPDDRNEIPHCLYEVSDPGEPSSAGKWLPQARFAIRDALEAGRTPIVVGGTGLYFEALRGLLADIPLVPTAIRADAEALYACEGEEAFRARLASLDPASNERIARHDRQRLIRAFEVAVHTGKSLTEWQAGRKTGELNAPDALPGFLDARVETHLVLPPRVELYARCDARFASMVAGGALHEVSALLKRHLDPALPSMKILGVRELGLFLRSEIRLEEALAKGQQMTRNFAKRQMTWFRNQWKSDTLIVHG